MPIIDPFRVVPQNIREWSLWFGSIQVVPDDGSTGTDQLEDEGVTFGKIQNVSTNVVLGRDTAGSGSVEELDGDLFARVGDNEVVTGQWTFDDRIDLGDGSALRCYDSLDTNYAEFSHDGTDFNTSFSGTTDWNILSGIALKIFDSAGTDSITIQETGTTAQFSSSTNGMAFAPAGGGDVLSINASLISMNQNIGYFGGKTFTFYDSTSSDTAAFQHDGTDFNTTFTNTTDWNISGHTGNVNFTGSANGIRIYDALGTDYGEFKHSGSSFTMDFANTAGLLITNLTAGIQVRDGAYLRVYDSTDTDYGAFTHSGTDFNLNFANTASFNIDSGANLTGDFTFQGNSVAHSSGTTGGTGSAGAGNQYVELTINGTTYKLLHDGTV